MLTVWDASAGNLANTPHPNVKNKITLLLYVCVCVYIYIYIYIYVYIYIHIYSERERERVSQASFCFHKVVPIEGVMSRYE